MSKRGPGYLRLYLRSWKEPRQTLLPALTFQSGHRGMWPMWQNITRSLSPFLVPSSFVYPTWKTGGLGIFPFPCQPTLSALFLLTHPYTHEQGTSMAPFHSCVTTMPLSFLLSIHKTFLKLCPSRKHYKEVTLTMDQVSSLPALRVSPGWGGAEGMASAERAFCVEC